MLIQYILKTLLVKMKKHLTQLEYLCATHSKVYVKDTLIYFMNL